MVPRRTLLAVAACCALLLASICMPPTTLADETERMTLEDVVLLFVQGSSSEDLVRRIESSQVEFDLTQEMLDELRLAGLGEEVIEAMVRRQRELHPPPTPEVEPAEEATPQGPGLTVRLTLQGGTKLRKTEADRGMRVADVVPPDTLTRLGVKDPEARITDVAVYVACHTSTHVPDHWRSKTPLGRDFNSVTRHKMLAFHSEAIPASGDGEAADEANAWTVLNLELPEQLTIELDPSDDHDLSVGVAVQIDGRYYRLTSDETQDFVPVEHEGAIDVTFELPDDLDPSSIGVRLNL